MPCTLLLNATLYTILVCSEPVPGCETVWNFMNTSFIETCVYTNSYSPSSSSVSSLSSPSPSVSLVSPSSSFRAPSPSSPHPSSTYVQPSSAIAPSPSVIAPPSSSFGAPSPVSVHPHHRLGRRLRLLGLPRHRSGCHLQVP